MIDMQVEGFVNKVIASRAESGWCCFVLAPKKGGSLTCVGLFMDIRENLYLEVTGEPVTHPSYGKQLKANKIVMKDPPGELGMERFLTHVPDIGPEIAEALVESFGTDTMRVLREKPELLRNVSGIGEKRARSLTNYFRELDSYQDATLSLMKMGLTANQALKAIMNWGVKDSAEIIAGNPFSLLELPGIGFLTADKIAATMGIRRNDPKRIHAGIDYVVSQWCQGGHCWMEGVELEAEATKTLVCNKMDIGFAIKKKLKEKDTVARVDTVIYNARLWKAERRVAERMTHFSKNKGLGGAYDPDTAYGSLDVDPTDEQREAAEALRNNGFVITTGGPGTGKTMNARALVAGALLSGKRVGLCAPTGRAARRLKELTGYNALTIHNMLEYSFDLKGFTRHRNNRLEYDVVIVDESSMCCVWLMERLLSAVPDHGVVAMIGDVDQLPSVGPGAVLRDTLRSGVIPVSRLTKIHRQAKGSPVIKAAHYINNADDGWKALARLQELDSDGFAVEMSPVGASKGESQQYVLGAIEAELERLREEGRDLCRDVQVMAPMKRGPIGVWALNGFVREIINPVDERTRNQKLGKFAIGDRVIHIRNNYRLDVFNGMIGMVVEAGPGAVVVDYEGREVEYKPRDIEELMLAFAITIHKCVHPDTLVETPRGLLPIRDLRRESGVVATPDGPRTYTGLVENPIGELIEFVTDDGYRLTVTPEHGVDVWTGGGFVRVAARDIKPGALLRLKLGVTCDPVEPPIIGDPPLAAHNARRYRYPPMVTLELAEFLGLMVADGTVFDHGFRLVKRHEDVRDRFASLCESLFGASPRLFELENAYAAEVNSTEIVGWLRKIGGLEPKAKAVPDCILRSPVMLQAAFLRGLFEDGGVNLRSNGALDHIEWSTVFPSIEQVVRTMLLRLRIITGTTPNRPGTVYVYGQNAKRFGKQVGFIAGCKQARVGLRTGDETRYTIPLTKAEARRLRSALVPIDALSPSTASNVLQRRAISRHAAETALLRVSSRPEDSSPVTPEEELLRERLGFHYSAVREVHRLEGPSMCINVPDGHRFLQNGFSAWNSQGCEVPVNIVVMHSSHSIMLYRQLIYTAVTRASERCVLVGDNYGIGMAIHNQKIHERNTSLVQWLRGSLNDESAAGWTEEDYEYPEDHLFLEEDENEIPF